MATDKEKPDIFDTLTEVFDPDDYAELIRNADRRTRLNAYQDIIRLLTYRSKNAKSSDAKGDMEKLINAMFNKKTDDKQ